jgi:hypothetical protein
MKTNLQTISVILYLVSLFIPIFIGNLGYLGIMALVWGWIGLFALEITFGLPWIANLVYFTCLLIPIKKKRTRIILSGIMIIFGLFALGINQIPIDEGGNLHNVYPGFGMLFWLSSFVTLFIFNLQQYGCK